MTPTPQERTELEALERAEDVEPVLRWLRDDTHPLAHAAAALIVSAQSRLLSLAAQSEELRAELEKERADKEHLRREIEESLTEADLDEPSCTNWDCFIKQKGFQTERDSALESRRILESRYIALVTALKQIAALEDGYVEDGKEAAQVLTIIGNIVQDTLGALLDSEASDQGVTNA